MLPTQKPRMKICCISSKQEAQLAIQYGASALGLVSAMPSGPGVISETMIAEIADTIPPAVATFLLTSQQDAEAIIVQQRHCHTNTIQICDSFHVNGYKKLRRELPGIALVQVIHVRSGGVSRLTRRRPSLLMSMGYCWILATSHWLLKS